MRWREVRSENGRGRRKVAETGEDEGTREGEKWMHNLKKNDIRERGTLFVFLLV